jgi:hypothetical protein
MCIPILFLKLPSRLILIEFYPFVWGFKFLSLAEKCGDTVNCILLFFTISGPELIWKCCLKFTVFKQVLLDLLNIFILIVNFTTEIFRFFTCVSHMVPTTAVNRIMSSSTGLTALSVGYWLMEDRGTSHNPTKGLVTFCTSLVMDTEISWSKREPSSHMYILPKFRNSSNLFQIDHSVSFSILVALSHSMQ